MKKTKLAVFALLLVVFSACKKSDQALQITLTPSATSTIIGQAISVTLGGNANVSNWTVTPSSTATKTYGLTTSKINYFTFSQAGVYTVSVRARSIAYDSTAHQSLDSCWNHGGGTRGACKQGVDTASVAVTVTGK
jgi:hypothetical protein